MWFKRMEFVKNFFTQYVPVVTGKELSDVQAEVLAAIALENMNERGYIDASENAMMKIANRLNVPTVRVHNVFKNALEKKIIIDECEEMEKAFEEIPGEFFCYQRLYRFNPSIFGEGNWLKKGVRLKVENIFDFETKKLHKRIIASQKNPS